MPFRQRYKIQAVDSSNRGVVGEADDIHTALGAAWELNRHLEADVEILDGDQENLAVATVKVEWAG